MAEKKVDNVKINVGFSEEQELKELKSGERLSVLMGKLAKGVKDLIAHLADNVKHVTAEERTSWNGKAAGSHTHGAASSTANGFMSADDKTKLDGIATGANKYTHPTTAGNKHIPAGGASGQILRWSAAGTAAWGAENDTTYSNMTGATASAAGAAGLVPAPAKGKQTSFLRGDGTWVVPTNTTYSAATTSANGLMSAADKTKLDGISEEANNYTHPSYTARTGVPTANQTPAFGSTFSISQPVSDASGHVTAINTRTVKIPNTAASASAAGLMSTADKKKLDSLTESITISNDNNVTITEIIYNNSVIRLKIVISNSITVKALGILQIGAQLISKEKEILADIRGFINSCNVEYQRTDADTICLIANSEKTAQTISPGTYFI